TIDIVQSENHPTFSTLFGVQQQPATSQVNLFNADCSNSSLGSVSFTGIGQARISVSGATAGQVFIVSVKYSKDNLIGATAPTSPTTVTYRFETQVNGTAVAFDTVDLVLRSSLGAPGAGRGAGAERLTQQLVQPIVAEAMARWRAAGIDQDRLDALRQIDVRIADLPDAFLGVAAVGIIWISPNAAGWGWFIDPTPADDLEFSSLGVRPARGRMDLLTVAGHEMGHLLGFDHDDAHDQAVMGETLAVGIRRMPTELGQVQVVDPSHAPDVAVSLRLLDALFTPALGV